MDVYSGYGELVNKIAHFNQYDDAPKLEILRKRIGWLTDNRMNFNFDADTNSYIDLILFENSCKNEFSVNMFKDEPVPCNNSLPEFMIKNPFQIGIIPYLIRSNYNILDNIT
jgi:hypothetical protein